MIKITNKTNCCGCSACVYSCPKNCISLQEDREGFLYPVIDESICVNCHKCEKVCPVINKANTGIDYTDSQTKEDFTHRVCLDQCSDMPEVYAAYLMNTAIRDESTSGGVFTALANYIFDRNGWVFGVIVDEKKKITHYGTSDRDELYKFRGSKYVQSDITGIFPKIRDLLNCDTWVLFSGTPCQVEALKRFLAQKYDKLITVDIFCHGVGSPAYWKKYITYMEKKYKSSIKNIKFREKTYGYNSACMAVYFENGTSSHKGHDDDLYWTAFSKCFIFRPSCYDCRFKTIQHISDYTIGDFWSSKDLPEEFERANGCTLLLVQSNKAKTILLELKKTLNYQSIEIEKALLVNGGHMPSKLISSSPMPDKLDEFRGEMVNADINNLTKKYMPLSVKKRIKCRAKPILYKLGILKILKGLKNG